MSQKSIELNYGEHTLYNDESVWKKLQFMDRFDAMVDDARNPTEPADFSQTVDEFLEFGGTYEIKLVLTKIEK
jgi:hypothetical protein